MFLNFKSEINDKVIIVTKQKKLIPLLIIGILLIGGGLIALNLSNPLIYSNDNNPTIEKPNVAAFYTIRDPIVISGDIALGTFIATHSLNGDGTEATPYVIELFEIDGNSSIGISITNTQAYLVIQECKVVNGGGTRSGIKILNCINVNVTECEVTNFGYGIELDNATYCIVEKNNASAHTDRGIYLAYSGNSTVSENIANGNTKWGICLGNSGNTTLVENTARFNLNDGMFLQYSTNLTLTDNTVTNSSDDGIVLDYSGNSTLSGNTVNGNADMGFLLTYSPNCTLTSETANFNGDDGIHLSNSALSTVKTITANGNTESGIYTYYSPNSTLDDNTLMYNKGSAMFVFYSGNTTINGNTANGNLEKGLDLDNSGNSTVWDNDLENNKHGIYSTASHSSNFSGNALSYNTESGFYGAVTNRSIINGNTANNSQYGIRLVTCWFNNVSDNTANLNSWHGIRMQNSANYNLVNDNTAKNNEKNGIEVSTCCYNTISNNDFNNNDENGIYMDQVSNNNTIKDNEVSNHGEKGLYLSSASSNNISGNTFNNNKYGVLIASSQFNIVWNNEIAKNSLTDSYSANTGNMYDNGTVGNYWGDYYYQNPTATHAGGIWNTPYKINYSSTETDRYPQVLPQPLAPTLKMSTNLIVLGGIYDGYYYIDDGIFSLNWTIIPGASHYKIYVSNTTITSTAGLTALGNTTANLYNIAGLTNGSYHYVVVAVNGSGPSAISNCKSVLVAIPGTGTTTTTTTSTSTNSTTSSGSGTNSNSDEGGIPGYAPVYILVFGVVGILWMKKKSSKKIIIR
jgi:parallel beta-helix repeat protein